MAAKQETIRYWGTTAAERQAQFEADARVRVAAGWRAVSQFTEWPLAKPGLDLVVTYELVGSAQDEPVRADELPRPAVTRANRRPKVNLGRAIWKALPYLWGAAFLLVVANFIWFVSESQAIGDAFGGYQNGGHYFVYVKPGYKEVSQATWEWLRFHETISLSAFVAVFAGGFIGDFLWIGHELSGGINRDERARREAIVRDSGPLLASGRTSAIRVGKVSLGLPGLVHIAVYPGGVLVNLPFRPCHSILTSEIHHVSKSLLIEHDGVESKSPCFLGTRARGRLGGAILALAYPRRDPPPRAPWETRHPQLARAAHAAGSLVGRGVRQLRARSHRRRIG